MRPIHVLGLLLVGCVHPLDVLKDEMINECRFSMKPGSGSCGHQPESVGIDLRGRVVLQAGQDVKPLPFTALKVLRDGQVVTTGSTDEQGEFQFRHLSRGRYELVLDSDRGDGSAPFEVGFGTTDLVLRAKAR
jgi:hypothetical protein